MDFLLTVLTTDKHIHILRNLGASAEAQGPPISCLQGLEDHRRPAVKSKHQATGLVVIQSPFGSQVINRGKDTHFKIKLFSQVYYLEEIKFTGEKI